MTLTTLNKPNWKLAAGLPLCIFLACWMITFSSQFKSNPEVLSNAIVIDLLVTAPLIYFLAIRKTSVSKSTVTRVFIAGLLVAGWIINAHSNALLHTIKTWISPLVEATVIFFISRKFYLANKKAKLSGEHNLDFLTHCRTMMAQVLGNEKAGNIIASEVGVLYYAFIGRKAKNIDYKTTFTVYKENGILLVLGTFFSLFLIETIGAHFLLALWNKTFAWILTALSFYTCIQMYAHIKATKARATKLTSDRVEIYNGLAGDAFIDYNNIEKIELSNKIPATNDAIKIALIKGLENHNCIIYLKQPILVTRIFGIKKEAKTILFFIDRSKDFVAAVNLKLINSNSALST